MWPRWLPVQARLPMIAQIAGVVMLAALIADPWWTSLDDKRSESGAATETSPPKKTAPPAKTGPPDRTPAETPTPAAPPAEAEPVRPAHLNLDVRHNLRNVELTVTVDGERALHTNFEGSGKKFGVFGKRAERSYTRTLDLSPGVRVVRVRVRSAADKFDQTRVERFELGPASVAGLSITADKSGLLLAADRPALPMTPAVTVAALAPIVEARGIDPRGIDARVIEARAVDTTPRAADVFITELFKTLRQVLLAIAGFIASAATGFVVQEFMRSRKKLLLAEVASLSGVRRRREEDTPQTPAGA